MHHFQPYSRGVRKIHQKHTFSTPRNGRQGAAHPQRRIPLHGFGGRSVAPRSRRGKKRAPLRNAREPSRYRAWANTQNHHKVSTFRTRNSHTLPLKSQPGPLFRPRACQNAGRVVTSHGPPSDPARKPRHRAKRPPGPPPGRMPHFPSNNQGNGTRTPGPAPAPIHC